MIKNNNQDQQYTPLKTHWNTKKSHAQFPHTAH